MAKEKIKENAPDRFFKTYMQGGTLLEPLKEIWVDSATGVNYMFTTTSHGVSVIPLIDEKGKPLITKIAGTEEKPEKPE